MYAQALDVFELVWTMTLECNAASVPAPIVVNKKNNMCMTAKKCNMFSCVDTLLGSCLIFTTAILRIIRKNGSHFDIVAPMFDIVVLRLHLNFLFAYSKNQSSKLPVRIPKLFKCHGNV